MSENNVSRRALLGRGSALAMGLLMGGPTLQAEALEFEPRPTHDDPPATPVTVALIGAGDQGRELLKYLAYVPGAVVKYVCDTYDSAGFQKRALENAPKATFVTDYKKVLADKDVQGVFIATASHQHRQVVIDALAAGKHVYCEAPLASSIEEAKAIAQAGKAAGTIFQVGLQNRTNGQHHHVKHFIDTGALGGTMARVETKWNKKTSWRRTAPTGDREETLNWRLRKATSGGLPAEIGIHQVDVASWYLKAAPLSVTGFGAVNLWKDGRDVADTVSCVFEYPNAVRVTFDATLANSFGAGYELFQGNEAAVLLRDARAWLFKEADATALGWEVYARREKVGDETGIMLVADASKLLAQGKSPSDFANPDPQRTPFYFACEAFIQGIRTGKSEGPGAQEGFTATVVALKAHEAVQTGNKIAFTPDMFTL
jgi:predicted dehydrogenase